MVRTRAVSLLAGGIAVALLALYIALWTQVTPTRERGSDFSASYVAATLLRDGEGPRLYDQALEARAHQAILPEDAHADLPFITPPTTAILALPFTLFDPGAAFRLWSLLQLAMLAAAAALACRFAPWPASTPIGTRAAIAAVAVAGTGTFAFLLLGQVDGFSVLGLAAAYACWRRGHAGRAGFWLGLGSAVAKPHLALGLAVWLLARRDWRALGGAGAGVGIAAVASLLAVGPAGISAFAGALGLAYGHTPAASTVGLPGLAASWLDSGAAGTVLGLAAALAALGACALLGARGRGTAGLEVSLAGAAALSLAVSPHLLPHDLVILAPVFVWLAAIAARTDGAGAWPGRLSARLLAGWAVLNALLLLDTGTAALAPPGRLVPWALLGIGVAAVVQASERAHLPARKVESDAPAHGSHRPQPIAPAE